MKFLCLICAEAVMEQLPKADADKHFQEYVEFTERIRTSGQGLERAIQVAARIPGARLGCVEVRPVADDPQTLALGLDGPPASN